MSERLSVDGKRLYDELLHLGEIGAYEADNGLRGVARLALTQADGDGRRHVVERMKRAGLDVTVDRIGNVYGRRQGRDASFAPVIIGSHIDSVATGGKFDGCLGVLGGLEVVATLNEAKRETLRSIVIAFFTEEEGARFGTDMLGSAVAVGRIPVADAYGLRDRAGKAVRDELDAIGFLGDAPELLPRPHAYLECHIEQGPVLRAAGKDIGVVTGVQAICWHELTIVGKSAHAGTTPMSLRADPGLAASRINVALREMTASGRYGGDLRATMGVFTPHPGLVNVVPGRVVASVDIRNPDDATLARAEADVIALYAEVARAESVTIAHRRTARTNRVAFDPRVQDRVAAAAAARGLSSERIVSGAGHDAQEMAVHCPSGMVFVPGEYDGISHNPRELSTPGQCENGVNVLLDMALAFANEGGGS